MRKGEEIKKRMQESISKEELDRAFDARFPKEMQVKLHNAKVAIAGLILRLCLREVESGNFFSWILMWWMLQI